MTGTKSETLAERVHKEIGFYLFSPTITGFAGVQVSGVTLVCGLDGNIIRRAAEDDVELFQQSKS